MRTVRVDLELKIPVDATEEQISEWIRFELHDICSTPSYNPCLDYDLQPIRGSLNIRENGKLYPLEF